MGVVLDEADESELWLSVCSEKKWGEESLREPLLDESGQLRAIFGKAFKTARDNEARAKKRSPRSSRR